jgi:hypothetical protein
MIVIQTRGVLRRTGNIQSNDIIAQQWGIGDVAWLGLAGSDMNERCDATPLSVYHKMVHRVRCMNGCEAQSHIVHITRTQGVRVDI